MKSGSKWLWLAVAFVAGGCALFEKEAPRQVIVPDELLADPRYDLDGAHPRQRYVLRMTDGERDWEVEFPEVATGYEVRIPLEGEPRVLTDKAKPKVTSADRAIMEDMVRNSPDPAVAPPAPSQSYLAGLVEIRDLYRTRHYELALLRLVDLEKEYPNDDKLLAMRGSLYRQLGRTELAREAWEKALLVNPTNQVVIDALARLPQPGQAGH